MHHKVDVVDEERYDVELKVTKNEKEVSCYKHFVSAIPIFLAGFKVILTKHRPQVAVKWIGLVQSFTVTSYNLDFKKLMEKHSKQKFI